MTKYRLRMLFSALMIGILGISTANAGDMKSDTMEQKMAPAKSGMEMMQEESMKKEMNEGEMEAKEGMKDGMMEKPSMESDKGMMQKPMAKKAM
ncbi:hypothetical protein ACFL3U_01835 [Pseudomonadota bacterium]